MAINLGSTVVNSVRLGSTTLTGVYAGTNKLWPTIQNLSNLYLVGGQFTSYSGIPSPGVSYINSGFTASIMSGSNSGINPGSNVFRTAIFPDNSHLLMGTFTSFNGVSSPGIVKLKTDGTVDTSFNVGSGINVAGNKLLYGAITFRNRGVIIYGDFDSWNGTSSYNAGGVDILVRGILKLNASGSIDTTFRPGFDQNISGTGFGIQGVVNCAVTQSDGNILVGGTFSNYGFLNPRAQNFCRLTPTGTIDDSFFRGNNSVGFGSNSAINQVRLLPSGSIMVGGGFSTYFSQPRLRLAKLNMDGTLNTSLNPNYETNGPIRDFITDSTETTFALCSPGFAFPLQGGPLYQAGGLVKIGPSGTFDRTYTASSTSGLDTVASQILDLGDTFIVVGANSFNQRALGNIAEFSKTTATVVRSGSLNGGYDSNTRTISKFNP